MDTFLQMRYLQNSFKAQHISLEEPDESITENSFDSELYDNGEISYVLLI